MRRIRVLEVALQHRVRLMWLQGDYYKIHLCHVWVSVTEEVPTRRQMRLSPSCSAGDSMKLPGSCEWQALGWDALAAC